MKTKASIKEIKSFKDKIRFFLIQNGFGLCSRGPICYEWLCILYGRNKIKKLWSKL